MKSHREGSPRVVHTHLLYFSQTKITKQGTCFKGKQNVAFENNSKIIQQESLAFYTLPHLAGHTYTRRQRRKRNTNNNDNKKSFLETSRLPAVVHQLGPLERGEANGVNTQIVYFEK